jgi:FixJ family two-component response regulator
MGNEYPRQRLGAMTRIDAAREAVTSCNKEHRLSAGTAAHLRSTSRGGMTVMTGNDRSKGSDAGQGEYPMSLTNAVIHIVDDDESMRESLRRLLELGGHKVRCHASAGDFLMAWPIDAPACVLLDVRMPGPSGLDLQVALSQRHDAPPVVLMSGYGDIPMSVLAIKRGAVDFLTKPIEREPLLAAVTMAIERSQQQQATDHRRRAVRERFEMLTTRERTVFEQVAAGRLNKQIAATLCTCERTVKAHRANVMHKMQAHSVAELVRIAIQLEADAEVTI